MASELDTLLDRHRDACLAKWATRMDWLERKTSDAEMDQAVAIEAKCREAIKALINPERCAREHGVIAAAREIDHYGTAVHFRNDLRDAIAALDALDDAAPAPDQGARET